MTKKNEDLQLSECVLPSNIKYAKDKTVCEISQRTQPIFHHNDKTNLSKNTSLEVLQ
jgi:hypothetical protein